jgi:hypothetical protein
VTLADYFSPARRKREQKVDLDQNWKPLGDYFVAAIRSILSDRGIDSVTVISRANAIKAADLSDSTWERLEAAGDVPPVTWLSPNRKGYRLTDFKAWLDARRERKD